MLCNWQNDSIITFLYFTFYFSTYIYINYRVYGSRAKYLGVGKFMGINLGCSI